jgi:hypothetical protein
MPLHAETPAAPGLGRTPEGQRPLDAILHVELAVLYFPFRRTTPSWHLVQTRNILIFCERSHNSFC